MLSPIARFSHFRSVVVQENALFRKYIDRNFPDLTEVARMCPLVMVNSDELYDQARPTFHKVINIGGIGMTHGDQKPLEGVRFHLFTDTSFT